MRGEPTPGVVPRHELRYRPVRRGRGRSGTTGLVRCHTEPETSAAQGVHDGSEAQVAGRAFEPGDVAGGVAPGGGIAALAESELAPVRPDRERDDVCQREALADPVGVFPELSGDLLEAALPEGPRRGARWEGCHGSSPRRGKR